MRAILAVLALGLTSCVSRQQVYVVPAPHQPGTYVKDYDVYPTFHGGELIIGLPGLKSIPVIGPLFGELIQIRAGINQDVIVPQMEPFNKVPGVVGAPPAKKAIDTERGRWSSYHKK